MKLKDILKELSRVGDIKDDIIKERRSRSIDHRANRKYPERVTKKDRSLKERKHFKKKQIEITYKIAKKADLVNRHKSPHSCISRDKICFSEKHIDTFIKNYKKKQLNKYYCKLCKAWHLTSQV